jgi:hypothetical protein
MSKEAFLENLLAEYKKEQTRNLSRRWVGFFSWLLRMYGSQKEFSRLLSDEINYSNHMVGWLVERIERTCLTKEEVS